MTHSRCQTVVAPHLRSKLEEGFKLTGRYAPSENSTEQWIHTLSAKNAIVKYYNNPHDCSPSCEGEKLCVCKKQIHQGILILNYCFWPEYKFIIHNNASSSCLAKKLHLLLSTHIKIHWHLWPWTTKPVLSRWGIFVAIAKKYIVWVKIIDFSFMPKIIRTLNKDHVPWLRYFVNFQNFVNISKLNFLLVICIAKNFIWTTLKAIFSIFRFFLHTQIPDFQIVVSWPNIVLNITWKAYLFSF